jgi:glycosyltransferase involved in cell wall biosynthesis
MQTLVRTTPPRISVVIPTYNRARDIRRCLDSLIEQTFKNFEVLVCDDGSSDDTAQVVAGYKARLDLSYHWAANFGGPARPRNVGVRMARGEYVAFLDSDDWWTARKLERSLQYLEQGADVVYHDLYLATRPDQKLFLRILRSRGLERPAFDDLLANGSALNNSSVVARRNLLLSIGGFSEDRSLIAAEDYDAWLRIARITDAFVRIPQTLGFYWTGSGNLSNPRRTLTILDALEERYSRELHALGRRRGIYWLRYLRAKALLEAGSYELARQLLKEAWWNDAPPLMRLKRLWMLLLSEYRGYRSATTGPA